MTRTTMNHNSRQAIDDLQEINPHTGLPKHIYEYNHKECALPAFRGTFQMRGKKYHSDRFPYDPSDRESKQRALDACVEDTRRVKLANNWFTFVANKEYHGNRSTKGATLKGRDYNSRYGLPVASVGN